MGQLRAVLQRLYRSSPTRSPASRRGRSRIELTGSCSMPHFVFIKSEQFDVAHHILSMSIVILQWVSQKTFLSMEKPPAILLSQVVFYLVRLDLRALMHLRKSTR